MRETSKISTGVYPPQEGSLEIPRGGVGMVPKPKGFPKRWGGGQNKRLSLILICINTYRYKM